MSMEHISILFGIMLGTLFLIPYADGQEFEKATLQETLTILYDQKFSNSIITSIGIETTNNNEIRIPEIVLDKINANEKIRSVVFTNSGECVIGVTSEEQCIMINFDYQQLKGDGGIRMVQDSARNMGNEIIDELNTTLGIETEFHSTFIHTVDDSNLLLETSGAVSGRGSVSATYTIQKQATDFLFSDLAARLVNEDIREGGGFFGIAENLAKNDDSIISISIIRNDDSNLMIFKVADESRFEEIDISKINVLEGIGIEEITRSKIFDERNVPLNSIINLLIIPEKESQVSAIATHVITDVTTLESISKKGWFFSSPAGQKIDGKFLFGQDEKASQDELRVETTVWDGKNTISIYSVEDIPQEDNKEYESVEDFVVTEKNNEDEFSQYIVLGIIIAVGIGAAIFYLKGYKPKR